MARTEKKKSKSRSSSYFLGCFGFPREIDSDKPPTAAAEDGGETKMMTKKKKKQSRWLLCTKFRLKNGEIKPAPIEEKEKPISSVEDETDKKKSVTAISRTTDRNKNIPVDDKAVNRETKETKPKELTQDRSSKPNEPLSSSKEDTCPERISDHGKPDLKLSRARNGSRRVQKLDPVIGISVIILTLVIMLVWGRLCAILCTSAWCYFLPRLKEMAALAKRKRSGGSSGSAYVPDLNSESYKRKVVLDGFLGRQNRVSLL